jgi:hypothetical protein
MKQFRKRPSGTLSTSARPYPLFGDAITAREFFARYDEDDGGEEGGRVGKAPDRGPGSNSKEERKVSTR